ncbi:uncharacterized protein [Centroberyx affinis]|uniref:uncharacterized protein isoform X2 n=1 Tax=Centroberyx affinis TaxID=166261 RepID=UPI003A5BFE13
MPLFRASGKPGATPGTKQRKMRTGRKRERRETDEDGSVVSLTRLCLLSLADNMKTVWVKDYADNYLDQYCFRHIMGPFNILPGELVEELTCLLSSRQQLSRAALHLLLVPQLRGLSLAGCPGLATSALCTLIAARCQVLSSLDLSGAQQLPSQVQCDLLSCLPVLRSLSLAGTPCDRRVIRTLARCCPLLCHLDVSRCHFLSPAALLALGGGAFSSSSSTLSSLLALDIGFGEEEGDPTAAAACLLLSMPRLERVAMACLAQACSLICRRDFGQTDELTRREGVPRLEEVWRERRLRQGMDSGRKNEATNEENEDEEEDERMLWEGYESESEDDTSSGGGVAEKGRVGRAVPKLDAESLTLRLRDVQGLSFASLETVGRLCPDVHSVSLDFDDEEDTGGRSQGSVLAAGLQTWSGQLRSLSLRYPGPLVDLLPALQGVGSSLVSLTLEGVKTSPHTPLLEVIQACPRLRELLICAEPPTAAQDEEEEEDEEGDERNLPSLPNLYSLTLNFSYEHSQMKPVMSWMSLKRVLKCLLSGSPLLEKVSLVALPCPLNSVFQDILSRFRWNLHGNQHRGADSSDLPPLPLGRVQHLSLARSNVSMQTVIGLVQGCKRLKYLDLSCCWEISRLESLYFQTSNNVQLVWT